MLIPQPITPTKRSPTFCIGFIMLPLPQVSQLARHILFKAFERLYFSRMGNFYRITRTKYVHVLVISHISKAPDRALNQALEWIPARCRPMKMNFSNEKLVFTQSEIGKSNFFLDKNSKIYILNFEDVVILPESLASFTTRASNGSFFPKTVAEHLQLPLSQ